MTAPTILPAPPAVPATAGPTGSTATGGGSPAFASALDDALASGGQQAGPTAEDATEEDTVPGPDAAVAPAAVLTPPPWILLSAAPAPSAPVVASPGAVATPALAPAAAALPAAVPGALPPAAGPMAAPAGPVPPYAAVADAGSPVPAAPVPAAATAALAGAVMSSGPSPAPGPAGPAAPPALAVAGGPAAPPFPGAAAPPTGGSADTATDDGRGDSAGATAPEQPMPDADPLAALGAPAAPAPATPAVAASATSPSPAADQPVATQLGRQLAVLTEAPDGTQTMTLVITPDELGPVSIQATITDGTLDLTLLGAHEHGRHALVEALPDLRRELETAGLSVSRLEVGTDAGGDDPSWQRAGQQLPDPRGGSHGQPGRTPADGRGRVRDDEQNGAGTPVRTTDPSTSRGVDVRV